MGGLLFLPKFLQRQGTTSLPRIRRMRSPLRHIGKLELATGIEPISSDYKSEALPIVLYQLVSNMKYEI